MSETIYALMPKAMQAIGAIGKDHQVTGGGPSYRFRSIDDVLSKCGPVLARLGITVTANVTHHNVDHWLQPDKNGVEKMNFHATLLMQVTFFGPGGDFVMNTLPGEGLDYAGDKATNKAISAAFKYGMFLGLVIPVDAKSIIDSDRERRREAVQGKAAAAAPGTHVDTKVDLARKAITLADSKSLVKFQVAFAQKVAAGGHYTEAEAKTIAQLLQTRENQLVAEQN